MTEPADAGWMTDALIFLGVLGFVGLLLFAFLGGSSKKDLQKRAEKVARQARNLHATTNAAEILSLRRRQEQSRVPFINKIMARLPNFSKLQATLDQAGIQRSAKRFMFRNMVKAVLIAIAVKLMGKPLLLGIFLGVIFGVWLPLKFLKMRAARRLKRFIILFPDAIDLIVRGLRAGLPVGESIQIVAKEISEPVASVFANIANTTKLGVPLEKALQDTAKRLDCTEFNFFITSIILQRETGGNLSEILNNLSDVLRKRTMMRLKIKAMSTEARASAWVIGSLPFVVMGLLGLISPGYIVLLFIDFRGNIAIAAALTTMTIGILTMRRMARFEI